MACTRAQDVGRVLLQNYSVPKVVTLTPHHILTFSCPSCRAMELRRCHSNHLATGPWTIKVKKAPFPCHFVISNKL